MTQQKATITDYQLIDHGVEGSQYFQGCGVAFSHYNHVATGCGENFAEALEDCLEGIAQQVADGVDVDALEQLIRADEGHIDPLLGNLPWPTEPSATSIFKKYNPEAYDKESDDWNYDSCDLYYYVSIRFNVEGEKEK